MTAKFKPAWASYHQISPIHMAWFLEVKVSAFILIRLRTQKLGHHPACLAGDLGAETLGMHVFHFFPFTYSHSFAVSAIYSAP